MEGFWLCWGHNHVTDKYHTIKLTNNYHHKLLVLLTKIIPDNNIIFQYQNTLLILKYNHFKI